MTNTTIRTIGMSRLILAAIALAAVVAGVVVTAAQSATPQAHADARCDALRAKYGAGWPCISVPSYTPPSTPSPVTTAPGATDNSGNGVNMHVDAGPGPGGGNGTPIVPVPGRVGTPVEDAPAHPANEPLPQAAPIPAPTLRPVPMAAAAAPKPADPPPAFSILKIPNIFEKHNAGATKCTAYQKNNIITSDNKFCITARGDGRWLYDIDVNFDQSTNTWGDPSPRDVFVQYHVQVPGGQNGPDHIARLDQPGGVHETLEFNRYVDVGEYSVWARFQDKNGNWGPWKRNTFVVHE